MKAILRSINNFSCKLKQSNNLKYNISPKIRSNKFKSISGNGNIVIEDALNKYLKDYKIYGNTYQNSTSGKNLNIYPYNGRTLPNGITFTSNADGTLIIDGQNNNNGNSAFYFFSNSSNPRILEAGTYYFIPPSNTHVQYVIYDGINYYTFNSNNNYHRTFQTSISAKVMYIQVSKGSTAIFNGLKVYPMLSTTVVTEDDYESYTGGQPCPNPDYPQEMVSCGINETGLPFGYTQVDYLKSESYTNYFIIPHEESFDNLGCDFKINIEERKGQYGPHIISSIDNKSNFWVVTRPSDLFIRYYMGTNTFSNIYNNTDGIGVDTRIECNIDGTNKVVVNETNIGTLTKGSEVPNTNDIYLLNYPGSLGGNYGFKGKFYYCKLYSNGNLIYDFIPCYRNSDNEIGLYDLVNNVFYTNQGTGVFTYGSEIEKGGYKIPVNVRSENLFSPEYAVETQYFIGGGVSTSHFYTLENNKIIMEYPNVSGARYLNKIKLSAGTYYLKAKLSQSGEHTTSIFRYAIRDFTNNVAIVSSTSATVTNDFSLSFTILEELDISIMLIPNNTSDGTLLIENVMLSKIDEPYQPYYNQTTNIYLDEPLRKTKDESYADYVDFINRKIYRQLGQIEFSNCAGFNGNGKRNEYYRFTTSVINNLKLNIPDAIESSIFFFCNYFSELTGSTASSKIRFNIPHKYLGTTSSSTDAEAKQALVNLMTGKTMLFIYPLKTVIEEDIELPNIKLIEGKNIISIGTEVQGVFEAEYYSKEIIDISNYKYNLRKVED